MALKLTLVLLLAAALSGCADPVSLGPPVASETPADAAPEEAFSPLASLSPDAVPPGDSTTAITITAGEEALGSGTYFRIERWDGEDWELQHYVWHGEVQPADLGAFNDDGYGLEPGESLTETLPLEGLEEGVHRVGLEMWRDDHHHDDRIDVYARLDVTSAADERTSASQLVGTEWRSAVVEGLKLPADQHIQLTFDDGRIGAFVACNGFGGPYEVVDGQLVVNEEDFASDLIDCAELEGSWDDWVTDLLLGSPTVELDDQRLTLTAGDDTVTFERYIEPTPTPNDPDAPLSTWVPPADYRYAISGSCGPDARFFGEREVTVRDGVPSDDVAFLPTLIADAEEIRAGGADIVRVEHDPGDGHPTAILWNVAPNSSTDSEVCYSVTDYLVLGDRQPATADGPLTGSELRYSCTGTPFDPATVFERPDATHLDGPVHDALREALAEEEPAFGEYPPGPWVGLGQTADSASFLAAYPDPRPAEEGLGVYLTLGLEDGEWIWAGAGGCQPTAHHPDLGPATWALSGDQAGPEATSFVADVTERACASGQSSEGRVAEPVIDYRDDAVVVTFFVEPLGGDQTCPGNPSTPVEVELAEPLGDRQLLDGGLWPPSAPTAG